MAPHRNIGFHLRLTTTYTDLITDAAQLRLNTFQFLPLRESTGRYVFPSPDDYHGWVSYRSNFDSIYLHSSFKINLCTTTPRTQHLSRHFFAKEIDIATQLGVTAIVLHPGHKSDRQSLADALHHFTATLCSFARNHPDLLFLVENTAHSSAAIGSNLTNFITIHDACAPYHNIGFCLDTAHAFAVGYDLAHTNKFIDVLSDTMKPEKIHLIHCNDTPQPHGSRIDQHAFPGHGAIGSTTLHALIEHPRLAHIPCIIELSSSDFKKRDSLTSRIDNW